LAPIYHFTHGRNLASILADGELRPSATAATTVDIADAKIKTSRESRIVTCGPGGLVGEYVPFYFAPRSPMLFRIQQGGVEGVDGDPRGLVYFATTTERLEAAGLRWVFTDGNAAAAVTRFFDDIDQLAEIVDWPLMAATYWSNTTEDGDRVRRRGAEFLVYGAVPLAVIDEIGVYDAAAQARAREILVEAGTVLTVNVRQEWYFSRR
jgi:ssDNA thymidine ADP-ribosyltransferase, DarT